MVTTANDLPNYDVVLDTTGLYCPEPIMLMHNKVREMERGTILKIIATDPATTRDVPKFCHFLGHELVNQTQTESHYLYFVRLG